MSANSLTAGFPMKTFSSVVLLSLLVLSGCMRTVRFYPVQGPLATQTPSPVAVGKVTGALNSGSFSVTLSDGEVCKGHWSVVPRPSKSSAAPDNSEMAAVWDTVYGSGFYTAHVLGAKLYARSQLAGDRGTKLEVEMYRPEGNSGEMTPIKGVGKDDKGNIYKLTF